MNNISDLIERYLKQLLAESKREFVEVQRSDLALRFSCVPSQINYVLTTRFSAGHGYFVESRRGSGGYIRIIKIPLDRKSDMVLELCDVIGEAISQADADGVIKRLLEEKLISLREARVMHAAVDGNILKLSMPVRDKLRALLLKAMIKSILRGG
ncbi:MAG: CtsR family transcriptional regulator [Desulfotomaculaceae bacterium]|nr:CtsR family transcriptional regulator [Desulfotomaculaceae bacterium]MDD4767531.1 CtsR family transcriptional regulator [Desulfotomaculaceae bacterium]